MILLLLAMLEGRAQLAATRQESRNERTTTAMNQPPSNTHELPDPALPSSPKGTAHIDDIVEEERWPIPGGSRPNSAAPSRETDEKVAELGGHRVGDIGVIRGQRVRIMAIYKNGKFDYELLASTR